MARCFRRRGAEFFLDLLGFDAAVSDGAAVVTGEGRMDGQTLAGELPAVVAARSAPRRVHAVVGQSLLTKDERLRLGPDEVVALGELTDEDPHRDPDLARRLAAVAEALISRQVRATTAAGRSGADSRENDAVRRPPCVRAHQRGQQQPVSAQPTAAQH